MRNPYAWNAVNPALCYGRDVLLSDLLSGLPNNPRTSFGIAGGRRMGKTTLLQRLANELRAGFEQWQSGGLLVIPIYIDGVSLPRPLMANEVWGSILVELQRALPNQTLRTDNELDFAAFKEIVQPVFLNLPERARIIVIFDEIEPIVACDWSESFFNYWRALLGHTPNLSEYFTAVFAGARDMDALRRDISSPLRDILEWRSLRVLEYDDACALMQEPIDHQWPDDFLQHTYAETGGHPMLLQYVMQQVCASAPEFAAQSLEYAIAKFERERSWQFNEWWGRYCTSTAQRIYARLPDDGSLSPLRALIREFGIDETHDALEILQHVGLIASEDEGMTFRYSGEMFRRWYRVYGTLTESAMHDSILYQRLGKMGAELADKYLSAWKIYQADLPNYSGAVGEMRDTLTLLLDKIAPDEQVQVEPGFRLEPDQKRPTRRQRVRYAVRRLYQQSDRAKEIVSDFALLETSWEQLAQIVASAYGGASAMTHTTATREHTYRALKQWDSILAQLLPDAG